ncbi:MAG: hypothetical protein V4443_07875 [Pseudomonadota bacterium]
MKFLLLAILLVLSGCTSSINKLTTPNAQVSKDKSDGSVYVRQPPVNASRDSFSSGDAWHTLGFEWLSRIPDTVFFTVGVIGQASQIQDLALIADDQVIQGIKPTSDTNINIDQSVGIPLKDTYRRYSMPLDEFRKVAAARVVKMKIFRAHDTSSSQFGKDFPYVAVNGKFSPFLNKVDALLANPLKADQLAQ